MKSEEIKKLVAKSENAAVEFKRAKGGVPADFWPSYSAFANTDGGTVILGIREKDGKREIEGLPDAEKTVARHLECGQQRREDQRECPVQRVSLSRRG